MRRQRDHTEERRNEILISVAPFLRVIPLPPSSPLPQNESVALNRASRGFRMAVGFSQVAPLFAYRNV